MSLVLPFHHLLQLQVFFYMLLLFFVDRTLHQLILKLIQELLKKHQLKFNEEKVNSKMNILISEKNKKNQLFGKSPYNQTVIIKNILNSKFNKENVNHKNEICYVGKIKNVKIIQAFQNSLEGSIIFKYSFTLCFLFIFFKILSDPDWIGK